MGTLEWLRIPDILTRRDVKVYRYRNILDFLKNPIGVVVEVSVHFLRERLRLGMEI